MVTRVLDSRGRILHDCIANGCDVSWDGFIITQAGADAANQASGATAASPSFVKPGSPAQGQQPVDATTWAVTGNSAQLKQAADAPS